MTIPGKLFWGVLPLLLSGVLVWLTMEGHLNFGGGEKDVLLAIPLLLWSLAYLSCYLVLWWRGCPTKRSVVVSSGLATGLVLLAWTVLWLVSWLR